MHPGGAWEHGAALHRVAHTERDRPRRLLAVPSAQKEANGQKNEIKKYCYTIEWLTGC